MKITNKMLVEFFQKHKKKLMFLFLVMILADTLMGIIGIGGIIIEWDAFKNRWFK